MNPNNDVLVGLEQSPADAVSELSWARSPASAGGRSLLAASSWDCRARVYSVGVDQGGNAHVEVRPALALLHNGPVLAARFAPDGIGAAAGLATACADGAVRLWDLEAERYSTVGQHAGPARFVAFLAPDLVASAGVDGRVVLWDPRAPAMVSETALAQRPFAMDAGDNRIALALSDRSLAVLSVGGDAGGSPAAPVVRAVQAKLRMPLRSISIMPGTGRCVVGSIEGRCSVTCIDADTSGGTFTAAGHNPDFAFKCHRGPGVAGQHTMHAINTIASVPDEPSTFFTGGADGGFFSWNAQSKQRLKAFSALPAPVTSIAVSPDMFQTGRLVAIATGDDWSQGAHATAGRKTAARVYVHRVVDGDLNPKNSKRGRGVGAGAGGFSFGGRR